MDLPNAVVVGRARAVDKGWQQSAARGLEDARHVYQSVRMGVHNSNTAAVDYARY